jgi:chorismate dehydratase
MRIRIGQTHFKNTDFIYYAFQKGVLELPGAEFLTAHPPALGEKLLRGEMDLAPTSSVVYALHPDEFLLLPDFSISARGETKSILLFSDRCSRLEDLDGKQIALPGTSATSSLLLKALLRSKGGEADYTLHPDPDLSRMLRTADAALLIGDHALAACAAGRRVLADLGREWEALTGEKMVYALWVLRKAFAREHPEAVRRLYETLLKARRYAYANLDPISRDLASRIPIPSELMRWHLSRLDYGFAEEHQRGLRAFFEMASEMDLLDGVPGLSFFEEIE